MALLAREDGWPYFIEEECGTQRKILCSNNALQSASGGAGLAFEFDSFSSFLPFSHSSLVSYLNFILILVSRAEHTKDSFTLLFSNEKIKTSVTPVHCKINLAAIPMCSPAGQIIEWMV